MGKIVRKISRLFLVVVVLAGLLMLAAILFVPTDKIREAAVERVEVATGAEVTLGEASLRFFPSLGISLREGHIRGTGKALALATGSANNVGNYEMTLDRLDVRLSFLPLLKKTIVVDAISLAGPIIILEQEKGLLSVEDYSLLVSNLILPEAAMAVPDPVKGTRTAPGDIIPAGLGFGLEFHSAGITYQKNLFEDVAVTGQMDRKVLVLDSITANKAGGALAGEMIADWAKDPWGTLAFKLTVEEMPTGALFSPWVVGMQQRLDCTLKGGVAGGCSLKDPETVLSTLDLVGSFHSGEGILYAQDLLHDVSQYLGQRQDLKDISFHGLTHNFSVENGRYLVRDLEIDGLDTDWTCSGWIELQGVMDLGIKVKLPPGFTPDLGKWSFLAESLRDSEGRVPLAFKLKGKTSRPKVIMDFSGFSQMQKEAEVTAQEAVESAAKKGFTEILDKWKTR